MNSQIIEPKRIRYGLAIGAGGLHNFGFPSFDIHKHNSTLRLAPGLFYWGIGFSQKLFDFNGKIRNDRPIYLNAYYMDDYFLSNFRNRKLDRPRTDLDIYMLIISSRIPLNYRRDMYFEVGAGGMYVVEKLNRFPLGVPEQQKLTHILPMLELRIGGTFLQRKYYRQKFEDPDKGWFKIRIQVARKKKKKRK